MGCNLLVLPFFPLAAILAMPKGLKVAQGIYLLDRCRRRKRRDRTFVVYAPLGVVFSVILPIHASGEKPGNMIPELRGRVAQKRCGFIGLAPKAPGDARAAKQGDFVSNL